MEFFKKITIYAILLTLTLTFQNFVFAEEGDLNIQDLSSQDGLSFEQPLPEGLSVQSSTIDFHKSETIEFEEEDTNSQAEPTKLPTPTITPIKSTPTTKPKPTRTLIPTKISTPTPTPALSPTPTAKPTVTATQTGSNTSNGGMNADILFNMSNSYRAARGLAPFQKDERTCSLAAARAPEIAGELAAGTLHSGMYGRKLPYWNTENAIAMGPEEVAFNWWVSEQPPHDIHRRTIEGNYTYSCVACSGNACVQEFTNFQPK